MTYSEYLKLEVQQKGQLLRAHRRFFLLREIFGFAGAMALVLTIADATPWSLGFEKPLARLFFITFWSVAMAWWQMGRSRQQDSSERARTI
jgi:hypothetical protein